MQTFAWKHKIPGRIMRKMPISSHCHGRDSQQTIIRYILRSGSAQTKLAIGAPDDVYEQEADRVADQVMRMPEPSVQQKDPSRIPLSSLPKMVDNANKPILSDINDASFSPGQPLDETTRDFFEHRFQCSLTDVRVHDDRTANTFARLIGARAFAVGNSLFFADNEFNPLSQRGRHLIAHEIAHVHQQTAAGNPRIQRQAAVIKTPETPKDRRFEGFSPAQALVLKYAESKAFKILDQMVVNLLPWIAPAGTQSAFESEFHTLDPNRMIRVSLVLARIRKKLPGARYVYQPDCKHLAYTLPLVGPIHICPAFFDQSIEVRFNTLIHEGAHRFACRLDLGYADQNKNYNTFSVLRQIWNAEPYGELAEKINAQSGSTP